MGTAVAEIDRSASLKADIHRRGCDVRFGSKADIGEGATDVRFTPGSGH
jgi:hypothetical protein